MVMMMIEAMVAFGRATDNVVNALNGFSMVQSARLDV
jgi:hypothetical protein